MPHRLPYLKKQRGGGYCFKGDVQYSTGDFGLVKIAVSDASHEINPGEEGLGKPVESPRPDPSHRVVCSASSVRYHLRGAWSSSCRLVYYQCKHETTFICVSSL